MEYATHNASTPYYVPSLCYLILSGVTLVEMILKDDNWS